MHCDGVPVALFHAIPYVVHVVPVHAACSFRSAVCILVT
jgi:hypothetical protein